MHVIVLIKDSHNGTQFDIVYFCYKRSFYYWQKNNVMLKVLKDLLEVIICLLYAVFNNSIVLICCFGNKLWWWIFGCPGLEVRKLAFQKTSCDQVHRVFSILNKQSVVKLYYIVKECKLMLDMDSWSLARLGSLINLSHYHYILGAILISYWFHIVCWNSSPIPCISTAPACQKQLVQSRSLVTH